MFCIAAFIVLAIMSIFSAKYRTLAKKAWQCVSRKVTFRACDTNFKDEMKSRIIGKNIMTRPKFAKFLDRWLEILALVFVILSIWSLVIVLRSGLNLYVYGTCNPNNASSCALGSESCSVNTNNPGFWESLTQGNIIQWIGNEASGFGEAITLVPDRIKTWNAEDYVFESSTYFQPFDDSKPIAVEVIDPSCNFCAELLRNIKTAGFENKYNLTYLVYPIPDSSRPNGYKFNNSYVIATYFEAVKSFPLDSEITIPTDWRILEKLYTGIDLDGSSFQSKFIILFDEARTRQTIEAWLREFGYDDYQINQINIATQSEEIKNQLLIQKEIVEQKIKTVKIPTIIFDGKRHTGLLSVENLD